MLNFSDPYLDFSIAVLLPLCTTLFVLIAMNVKSFFFLLRFYLFIYEKHREERERQRHRQREKKAPGKKPDMGLDPGSLGSRPGLKAVLNR